MSASDIKRLVRKFKNDIVDSSERLGMDTALVKKDNIVEIVQFLKDDDKLAYNMLRHLTCVDYLHREPRFEVIYVLYSTTNKQQVVLKAMINADDTTIDSISHLYGSANWAEREVWDMYGIKFNHHPNMRRILLYEEFEGHPLRKDYDKQTSQPRVQLLRQERDAFEEFKTYHVGESAEGSRS